MNTPKDSKISTSIDSLTTMHQQLDSMASIMEALQPPEWLKEMNRQSEQYKRLMEFMTPPPYVLEIQKQVDEWNKLFEFVKPLHVSIEPMFKAQEALGFANMFRDTLAPLNMLASIDKSFIDSIKPIDLVEITVPDAMLEDALKAMAKTKAEAKPEIQTANFVNVSAIHVPADFVEPVNCAACGHPIENGWYFADSTVVVEPQGVRGGNENHVVLCPECAQEYLVKIAAIMKELHDSLGNTPSP